MKWITAKSLVTWSNERLDAPAILPSLVGQLIRASASDIAAFRFPSGDAGQIQGWDGRLIADPKDPFKAFIPHGNSVWECGVERPASKKAEKDYKKRTTDNPDEAVSRPDTTLVIVTAQIWARADKWCTKKRDLKDWKDVRVIDAVDLEDWLDLCQGVAATFARENGFAPKKDVQSVDEFWEMYSRRFSPALREEVLLAGRTTERAELEKAMVSGIGIQRCKGDSLDEVLAFMCATARAADMGTREFIRARALIVQTEEAARELRSHSNLVLAVRGAAIDAGGMLADSHRVIVPMGRDAIRPATAISLNRPTTFEMSEALKAMGLQPEEAWRLAHECGRSVTFLGQLRSRPTTPRTQWGNDVRLIPMLLAGAWDQSVDADRKVIGGLGANGSYEEVEQGMRILLTSQESPVELVGQIWAARAPVHLFVQLSHLLQSSHWERLRDAATTVLSEKNPALELPPSEQMYASLQGKTLSHSTWLSGWDSHHAADSRGNGRRERYYDRWPSTTGIRRSVDRGAPRTSRRSSGARQPFTATSAAYGGGTSPFIESP
jgi:hypothetical protein